MPQSLNAMLHKLWSKAVGTPGYDKQEWLWLERNLSCVVVHGPKIPISTIEALMKLTGSDPASTAEQVIDRAVECLRVESGSFPWYVPDAHAKNPPGDLRGNGGAPVDDAKRTEGVGETGDCGAGVGAGACERGASPVRGELPASDAGPRILQGEGGEPAVCDHSSLMIMLTDREDQIATLRRELSGLTAKLADEGRKTRLAERELETYANAWARELGPPFRAKRHAIDALVLTTRERMEELTRWRALEARGYRCFNCRGPHHTEACDQPEVNPT